jgi:ABC-type multidrug transport system fused ATPase/permease subunit
MQNILPFRAKNSTSPNVARKRVNSQLSARPSSAQRYSIGYLLRLLNRFVAGQRRPFLFAIGALVIESVTSIFEPYPLAYLIDFFKGDRHDLLSLWGFAEWGASLPFSPMVTTVFLLTLAIVIMAALNSLCNSMADIFLAQGGRSLGYNLRVQLYTHLQRLSLAYHDQKRTGDVLTRLTGDVNAVEDFVMSSLSDIIKSFLLLIGTFSFLLYSSWQVAMLGVVIVPVMAVVSNYFTSRIKAAARERRSYAGAVASTAQEMLSSIRVIQTYNLGALELKKFSEQSQKTMNMAMKTVGIQARFSWTVDVMEALAIAVVVWLGMWLVQAEILSVGMMLMQVMLIKNMFKPTRKIIKTWNEIGKVYASVDRIGDVLDRTPSVMDAPDAVDAPPLRGQVEFDNVNFAYRSEINESDEPQFERPALSNIRFRIEPGQTVALVGHTGAGKSTIIQLLPRLYDPDSGHILIDGQDIRKYTISSLRDQVSVVLQETTLFNGTVAENIAYGRANATLDEIVEAAKLANAHEFIVNLPDGYDAMLGERGANLSGGQRQRLAIARAFVRNAPILILDEPTTGLDSESSSLVLEALRTLMHGKTTIIISHDLSLVRQADQIIVMQRGKIAETGDHQKLLTRNGLYANFYLKQFGEVGQAA